MKKRLLALIVSMTMLLGMAMPLNVNAENRNGGWHNVTITTNLKDWHVPMGTDPYSLIESYTCDEGCELTGGLDIEVRQGGKPVPDLSKVGYATIDVAYTHTHNGIAHRGIFLKNLSIYDPADRVDHKINLVRPENGGMSVTVNSGNSGYPENIARRGDHVSLGVEAHVGYKVEAVNIVDKQGNTVPIEDSKPYEVDWQGGIITGIGIVLKMPGSDITVTAVISKRPGDSETPPTNPQPPKPPKPPTTFPDVKPSDWFYGAVNYVTSNDIMTGYAGGGFGPSDRLGRGQFATMLYRIEGSPATIFEDVFPDVPSGEFYSLPVIWANANEVITGYGDGRFGVSDSMTREQIATMMYRYAKGKGWDISVKGNIDGFPDAGNVTTFAREAMSWAVGMGLISGDQGKLNPQGESSRAVTATIIQRFQEKY